MPAWRSTVCRSTSTPSARSRTGRSSSISFAVTIFFIVGGLFGLVAARLIARYDVRARDHRRCDHQRRLARRRRPGHVAVAAVSRLRRVRRRLRAVRAGSDHHGGHPLVPSSTLGRTLGGVDRSVGRRHRAHAGRQATHRRQRARVEHAVAGADLRGGHGAGHPVPRPARSGRRWIRPRRRAPGRRCRTAARNRVPRTSTRCPPGSTVRSPTATSSCSVHRSAAFSSW